MKKAIISTLLLLLCSRPVLAGRQSPLANANKSGLYAKSIEQVLRLPGDEVDLATAALIISENWSDIVPGRKYLSTLDDMAREIRSRLENQRIPTDIRAIPVINGYLFDELGFKVFEGQNDPNNLFLHKVLDTKQGYCLSLSVLYLSLAERLDIPLYGVVVPGHFFVRYDDGKQKLNIETTGKGGAAGDEKYKEDFKIPQKNGESIYLKNLNKIQTLGCFFNNLGNIYSDINKLDAALTVLKQSIEINPTLFEARLSLGNVYFKKNMFDEAAREYTIALNINPNDPNAHNNIGSIYVSQGRLNLAVSHYKQAIKFDPNFVEAYKNLAAAYSRQQSFANAITQLNRAVALAPEDAGCYIQFGRLYSDMGDYEKSISNFKKALEIKSDDIDAYIGQAVCYNKMEMVDEEIAIYKDILVIDPHNYVALFNLGNIYFGQQKFKLAIEQYNKAVEIGRQNAMLYYNIGAAYSNDGDYKQASTAYLKAIELDPDYGDAHNGLAFVYYRLEKYNLAWQQVLLARQFGSEPSDGLIEAIQSNL